MTNDEIAAARREALALRDLSAFKGADTIERLCDEVEFWRDLARDFVAPQVIESYRKRVSHDPE
jgi:hypothetical protein